MPDSHTDAGNQGFRPGAQHPEPWRHDLNPDAMAGQNVGATATPERVTSRRTAYDLKDAHDALHEFRDDVLAQIPIVPEGTRLQQGATYIDLKGDRKEFTARADMEAEPGHWYVAKDEVDYQLWNMLIGVKNPERLNLVDER